MRPGPKEPEDPFVMPVTTKPAPLPPGPTPEQVRQSVFEKDDWLPDGVRRQRPAPTPFELCPHDWNVNDLILRPSIFDRMRDARARAE